MMTRNVVPMWRRVVCPGKGPDGDVWVTIELNDQRNPQHGPELLISAVEGPNRHGNARGGAGQCRDALVRITVLADGWTDQMVARLSTVWDRWHLNGMRAGSEAQEAWLRAHPKAPAGYSARCDALARVGLHPDRDGYRYGSGWKYEPVPGDVVGWLRGLPVTKRAHPWGDADMVRSDQGDPMECFGCGLVGGYLDVFTALPVRCPACGSYEVHGPEVAG